MILVGGVGHLYQGDLDLGRLAAERLAHDDLGADVAVEDLTGGGDHFRAEVVSDRFDGLSRLEQHRLVYDVFGPRSAARSTPCR